MSDWMDRLDLLEERRKSMLRRQRLLTGIDQKWAHDSLTGLRDALAVIEGRIAELKTKQQVAS